MGKNPLIGICGLCKQKKELENSHLLPNAIYKLLCKPFQNERPDQIGCLNNRDNKFQMLGHQITKYYLCDECEAILDQNGENKVIKELYSSDGNIGKFILRDKLDSIRGRFSKDHEIEYFLQDNLGCIDFSAYIHLILGIFWKASSTEWKNKSYHNEYRNALGSRYEEQIRRYLITLNPMYLNKIIITVFVDTSKSPIPWATMPRYYRKNGMNLHELLLPGICVDTTIGDKMLYKKECLDAYACQHLIFAKLNLQEGKLFNELLYRFHIAMTS